MTTMDRRAFFRTALRGAPLAALGLASGYRPVFGSVTLFNIHPEPREGIDGSGVLTEDDLKALGYGREVIAIYDQVREMPHIADGLGCYCGCSVMPGYRSLLTCYHETGMAMGCNICQGQARLAYGRFKEGQTLDQIRRAIDARFGR